MLQQGWKSLFGSFGILVLCVVPCEATSRAPLGLCDELPSNDYGSLAYIVGWSFGFANICPFEISGDGCPTSDDPIITVDNRLHLMCEVVFDPVAGVERGCVIDCPTNHITVNVGASLTVDRFTFKGSEQSAIKVEQRGGLRLVLSTFENNHNPYGFGGAINAAEDTVVTITKSAFYNNSAISGGAVFLHGNSTIKNSHFHDQNTILPPEDLAQASSSLGGTAIGLGTKSFLEVSNSLFISEINSTSPVISSYVTSQAKLDSNKGCRSKAFQGCDGIYTIDGPSTGCTSFDIPCCDYLEAHGCNGTLVVDTDSQICYPAAPGDELPEESVVFFGCDDEANDETNYGEHCLLFDLECQVPSSSPSQLPSVSASPSTIPVSASPSSVPSSIPSSSPSPGPSKEPSEMPSSSSLPSSSPSVIPSYTTAPVPLPDFGDRLGASSCPGEDSTLPLPAYVTMSLNDDTIFPDVCSSEGLDFDAGFWYSTVGSGAVLTIDDTWCQGIPEGASKLSVYEKSAEGCLEGISCLFSLTDFCSLPGTSITWLAENEIDYYIHVDGDAVDSSVAPLTVGLVEGGSCYTPLGPIETQPYANALGNYDATRLDAEVGEMWYSIIGKGTYLTANTCGRGDKNLQYHVDGTNPYMTVYKAGCTEESAMDILERSCGGGHVISWVGELDVIYYIRVQWR